jgi:hypothetical protein
LAPGIKIGFAKIFGQNFNQGQILVDGHGIVAVQ